jgi:hypothetical protein
VTVAGVTTRYARAYLLVTWWGAGGAGCGAGVDHARECLLTPTVSQCQLSPGPSHKAKQAHLLVVRAWGPGVDNARERLASAPSGTLAARADTVVVVRPAYLLVAWWGVDGAGCGAGLDHARGRLSLRIVRRRSSTQGPKVVKLGHAHLLVTRDRGPGVDHARERLAGAHR